VSSQEGRSTPADRGLTRKILESLVALGVQNRSTKDRFSNQIKLLGCERYIKRLQMRKELSVKNCANCCMRIGCVQSTQEILVLQFDATVNQDDTLIVMNLPVDIAKKIAPHPEIEKTLGLIEVGDSVGDIDFTVRNDFQVGVREIREIQEAQEIEIRLARDIEVGEKNAVFLRHA